MKVTVTVSTSWYSDNPTKRWDYGQDGWACDIEIEVPDGTDVDNLSDDELLELALEPESE
jgi:hypothetical protein